MHKRERQNYQILTSKGEISEQRRQENETAQKLYDKLLSNTSTLAVSEMYNVHVYTYVNKHVHCVFPDLLVGVVIGVVKHLPLHCRDMWINK